MGVPSRPCRPAFPLSALLIRLRVEDGAILRILYKHSVDKGLCRVMGFLIFGASPTSALLFSAHCVELKV